MTRRQLWALRARVFLPLALTPLLSGYLAMLWQDFAGPLVAVAVTFPLALFLGVVAGLFSVDGLGKAER